MKYFVYTYYVNNCLVYVGKATGNPYTRYWNHVKKDNYKGAVPFDCVDEIGIIPFESKVDMEICELFFIVTHKPILNEIDINPSLSPRLNVIGIPSEKKYSISEFLDEFNCGNSGNLTWRKSKISEEFIRCFESRPQKNNHAEAMVSIYYIHEKVVYLNATTGRWSMREWVRLMDRFVEEKADFDMISRIERYTFGTGAEAKIFEKYILASKQPMWCAIDAKSMGEPHFSIENLPEPFVLEDNELSQVKRATADAINSYKQKKEYYRNKYL